MTGRRATTAPTGPTPIEEVPPTGPPRPASPVEPEPQDTPEPTAEELDDAAALSSAVHGEERPNVFATLARNLNPAYREGYAAAIREFADAQVDDHPLSVWEAIAEVTRQVGYIAKDNRTESGERYNYRGIDDVFEALHPILGDVGLVILPGEITSHRRETRTTKAGATLNVALLDVRYRLIGPDGTRTWGASSGEAHDSGDKATQKAMSQAYKSFALQTFSIPTEASRQDEPDRTNEEAAPPTEEQRDRVRAAWAAAKAADSYDRLAAIRNQAASEGLLAVSLPGGEPLGLLFDRRRAELEGAGQ